MTRRTCRGSSGDTTCSHALLSTPGTTSGSLRSVASTVRRATTDACREEKGRYWYSDFSLPALFAKSVP